MLNDSNVTEVQNIIIIEVADDLNSHNMTIVVT